MNRAARRRWGWASVALGAVPVALVLARQGHGMTVGAPLRDVGWLVLLAWAEEAVFRGGLQALLLSRAAFAPAVLGLTRANLASSVLFSAAHLWAHPPLLALATFPVSLLLGKSYEHCGRLIAPAALHTWFNLVLYGASVFVAPPGATA